MPHHDVYVIELDKEFLRDRRFLEKNLGHDPDKACFYVGMTGKTPEERFEQHKAGFRACRYVKKYGLCLRPDQYHHFNPMTFEDCQKKEVELAKALRLMGHAVWQN